MWCPMLARGTARRSSGLGRSLLLLRLFCLISSDVARPLRPVKRTHVSFACTVHDVCEGGGRTEMRLGRHGSLRDFRPRWDKATSSTPEPTTVQFHDRSLVMGITCGSHISESSDDVGPLEDTERIRRTGCYCREVLGADEIPEQAAGLVEDGGEDAGAMRRDSKHRRLVFSRKARSLILTLRGGGGGSPTQPGFSMGAASAPAHRTNSKQAEHHLTNVPGREESVMFGYKNKVPPKPGSGSKIARQNSVDLAQAGLNERIQGMTGTHQQDKGGCAATLKQVDTGLVLLDLDKCSIFGNDGNDLGIVLQWMDCPYQSVRELYSLLVSPQLKPAYCKLMTRGNYKCVIYTMRATFLLYRSGFRPSVIPLRWNPGWHEGSQVYFPSSVRSAEDILSTYCTPIELMEEEKVDLRKSLERMLAARQAIMDELDLDEAPIVVVTATPKDVVATARYLGYALEHSFLWDDNERLQSNPRVTWVQPYNLIPMEKRERLMAFLNHHVPPASLDPDLVEFLMGAAPDDAALAFDSSGVPSWRIPGCVDVLPWAVPDQRERLFSGGGETRKPIGAMAGRVGVLDTGWFSPVTPPEEVPTDSVMDGPRPRGGLPEMGAEAPPGGAAGGSSAGMAWMDEVEDEEHDEAMQGLRSEAGSATREPKRTAGGDDLQGLRSEAGFAQHSAVFPDHHEQALPLPMNKGAMEVDTGDAGEGRGGGGAILTDEEIRLLVERERDQSGGLGVVLRVCNKGTETDGWR